MKVNVYTFEYCVDAVPKYGQGINPVGAMLKLARLGDILVKSQKVQVKYDN